MVGMTKAGASALSVDRIGVRYGDVDALRELSFDLTYGECLGLVGESGSGKSTALRAIAGLAPLSRGSIALDGKPVTSPRGLGFYRHVQMVFQDPYGSLHPRQTIERQLMEPLRVHGFADRQDRVVTMIRRVGLTEQFLYRYPHQLSGGQRQRVAIARALLMEPEIILLDEPTSALDVSIQAEILNLLMDLRDRSRLTYVLVSHDLSVVGTMCDRLLVMRNGVAVEEMTNTQLRDGAASTEYARDLLQASRGYSRAVAPEPLAI